MALLIDVPRWPWRGQLWAHLISDESLDELHCAARALNLRYVSFGRDHYDVPDHLWPGVCEVAELVDSRVIVRSLRTSGLRFRGGKALKSWRGIDAVPERAVQHDARRALARWKRAVRAALPECRFQLLERPGELLVLFLCADDPFVELGDLRNGPAHSAFASATVIETVLDGRYSVELVIPMAMQ